jgi:peptidoglycan/LPS O-acetylase OafA/YrhL
MSIVSEYKNIADMARVAFGCERDRGRLMHKVEIAAPDTALSDCATPRQDACSDNLQSPTSAPNRGIDSFRLFAFMAVFMFHLSSFQAGYLGVCAFFVLSGFLLTPILLEMKANLNTRSYFLHFYGRRSLRIFPLYYSYLMIVAVFAMLLMPHLRTSGQAEMNRYFAQLPWAMFYAYDFYHARGDFEPSSLLTHFWSLAVEEQYYIVWPFALLLVNNTKALLATLILFGPMARAATLALVTCGMLTPPEGRADLLVYVLPTSHIDAFAVGGFCALYVRNHRLFWSALSIAVLIGLTSAWARQDWTALGYAPFMSGAGAEVWGYSLLNVVFALALVAIRKGRLLPSLFESRLLSYFGRISYGLYVYHALAIWVIFAALRSWPTVLRDGAALAIAIAISAASYEFFEKPVLALKDRYFPREATEITPLHASPQR